MISIARIFGAPETVPAGNAARTAPIDVDRSRTRHAADVVAAEIDQHHVLRPFLEVTEQLFFQPRIFLRCGATTPGARERPRLDALALDLYELLGRRPDDVAVATEREKEHVRRRVDRAQTAVDVEWAGREMLAKALRNHDLEGVAGVDVLAGGVDHRVELAG